MLTDFGPWNLPSNEGVKPPDPHTTAAKLKKLSPLRPTLAIVLGSGFHRAADTLRADAEISYARLPGFLRTGVGGHAGKVLLGMLAGTAALVLSGRAHYYEGYTMEEVTFPVRVLAAFGIRALLLTNAAGGILGRSRPGDFMALTAGRPRIEFTPENGGPTTVLTGGEPSRPGAFRIEGAPPSPGQYRWALVIDVRVSSRRRARGARSAP